MELPIINSCLYVGSLIDFPPILCFSFWGVLLTSNFVWSVWPCNRFNSHNKEDWKINMVLCFIALCTRELIFSQRNLFHFQTSEVNRKYHRRPPTKLKSINTLSLCVSKIMDFQSAIEILAVLLNNWMTLDERFHLAKSHFAHLYPEIIMLALQSNHSKNIDVWKAPSSEPGILPALNKELFLFNQFLCLHPAHISLAVSGDRGTLVQINDSATV